MVEGRLWLLSTVLVLLMGRSSSFQTRSLPKIFITRGMSYGFTASPWMLDHGGLSLCATCCPNSASPLPRTATDRLTSKSGLPVCKYALGGAARSSQPKSLVQDYCQRVGKLRHETDASTEVVPTTMVSTDAEGSQWVSMSMAPFYFYYNPHRYPDFMQGIYELTHGTPAKEGRIAREDLFLASGGTDRSHKSMEERLRDALHYCGGDKAYLDLFVLEYVCPDEIGSEGFVRALEQARSWIEDGRVRYIAASTHSHEVGVWLASLKDKEERTLLDAMMLRYNMAHKQAAEQLSFPACADAEIPVLAFTTTRWNRLQAGHPDWKDPEAIPTTSDCLSFALSSSSPTNKDWPVEVVLHSARDHDELEEALQCLSSCSTRTPGDVWRNYGALNWNDRDGFDEYPEEQKMS